MKKWEDFIKTDMTSLQQEKILAQAKLMMNPQDSLKSFYSKYLKALSLAPVGLLIGFFLSQFVNDEKEEFVDNDIELYEDFDLISELEILEDMEVISLWEES